MENIPKYIVFIIVVSGLTVGIMRSCEDPHDGKSGGSGLEIIKNKDGSETAKTDAITSREFVREISKRDSVWFARLDKLIQMKGTQTAIVGSNDTEGIDKAMTRIDTHFASIKNKLQPYWRHDTLFQPVPVFEPVTASDSTKWIKWRVDVQEDTTILHYKIRNDFEISQLETKTGFLGLGQKKITVQMRNLNPNTHTTELLPYVVNQPKKRFSVGVGGSLGYGINSTGTLSPTFNLGLGIYYKLFSF